jgi:hypothetical protein
LELERHPFDHPFAGRSAHGVDLVLLPKLDPGGDVQESDGAQHRTVAVSDGPAEIVEADRIQVVLVVQARFQMTKPNPWLRFAKTNLACMISALAWFSHVMVSTENGTARE